ncbi:hypothetical protein CDSM653_00013 [Caldanaerobacter subterraneus subsp. pacificus DSM 12653]|uniref:DUF5659 domain-containing protein n=2 Tax=Caldanaerobacter subterraneus TaxID=911092 RepID=A0A0F5PR86_9THEO|nr:hypothetical protein CDSM653_00013 [Caldanaerobacter subterraneus subsp. pacificus DSM 12653]
MTVGIKLKSVEGNTVKTFVFEGDDKINEILKKFANGELEVNIKEFLNNNRILKTLVYERQ